MGELSTLLNSLSGNFFFQLTILLVLFGAIIVVIGQKTVANTVQVNRMLRGFYTLLLLRFGLTAAALGITTGGLAPETFVWIERGFTTAGWVVIVWLWAFPRQSKISDRATGLLTILAITLTFITIGMVLQDSALAPWFSIGWSILSLLIFLTGMVVLIRNTPALWGYGLSMLMLLFLAEAAALMFAGNSDPARAIIRLAAIATFPILLTLPQRIESEQIIQPELKRVIHRAPERKRVNLPPGVYRKFLELAAETDLLQVSYGITETVSYAMVADICLMLSRPTEQDEIIIYCGYDQVLEQKIMGAQIASKHLPMIASAIKKHAPLKLPASSASSDLKFLSSTLNLPKSGHLLVAPIRTNGDLDVGALVLLTPYSSRTWTLDDQTYLSLAAEKVGELLEKSQFTAGMRDQIETLKAQLSEATSAAHIAETASAFSLTGKFGQADSLDAPLENTELLNALEEAAYRQQELEAEVKSLRENNEQILSELGDESWDQTVQHLQEENIQLQLTVQELEAEQIELQYRTENYKTAHKESLSLIEQLHEENDRLKTAVETSFEDLLIPFPNGKTTTSHDHPEAELKEALREIAHLRNVLGESEIKVLELENLSSASSNTTRQWEMIINLAEDMRQPMSSVLGYSDFLLTESVGSLSTRQRKFLERVKTSTSRISLMVEDLIHIAAAESGKLKLNIGQVDLNTVVDSSIASSTVQMREKTISLLVNLPDDLPIIEGDRDAIRLTLIHLIHNATAVSPNHGKVTIELEQGPEDGNQKYVQILVSDTGGGIASEDLSKVFDRRQKTQGELIRGLGVSSSGLSIAKELVEAHGGRIWVENKSEEGATFFILLPMKQLVSENILGNEGV